MDKQSYFPYSPSSYQRSYKSYKLILKETLMNKKLVKHALCFLVLFALAMPVLVAAQGVNPSDYDEGDITGNINVPQGADLPEVVTNIINIVLGFLALIAVIIVLIGGFEWMTAGGNEDKVKTAKKRLEYGLIGLVIIFLAYAIVKFVLNKLVSVV